MTISAKYEGGVFRPLQAVEMEEGAVVEVLIPSDRKTASAGRSIRDLPFFGLWKDRGDIGEGVDYVDRLRDDPRQ